MRIAYLINTYPMTSQTFIRREIAELEKLGLEVLRFAHRPWETPLVDERDLREHDATRYLQEAGLVAMAGSVVKTLAASPRRFLAGLGLTLKCRKSSDRSTLRHIAYFVQACVLRQWLVEGDVEHLHAHFGTNSSDVAMLSRVLGGPSYSFTVHGPEAIERAEALNYPNKIGHAAFVAFTQRFAGLLQELGFLVVLEEVDRIHDRYHGIELGHIRQRHAVFVGKGERFCDGQRLRDTR